MEDYDTADVPTSRPSSVKSNLFGEVGFLFFVYFLHLKFFVFLVDANGHAWL